MKTSIWADLDLVELMARRSTQEGALAGVTTGANVGAVVVPLGSPVRPALDPEGAQRLYAKRSVYRPEYQDLEQVWKPAIDRTVNGGGVSKARR